MPEKHRLLFWNIYFWANVVVLAILAFSIIGGYAGNLSGVTTEVNYWQLLTWVVVLVLAVVELHILRGFIKSRRVFTQKVCKTVFYIELALSVIFIALPDPGQTAAQLAITTIGTIVFSFPLWYALYRYSFKPASVWK